MTDCPIWLVMYGWSWITFWATPDPVEKNRKPSWSSEQNNVGIRLIWHPKKTQIEIIINTLFPNPPFLPKSLWSSTCLCAGLSPQHSHPGLEASLPEKVMARNTQSRLESGMRHGLPCTNVLSSASSWEFNVFECLAAHIPSTQYLCDSPQQEVGVVMFIDHVVCAQMRKSLTHHKALFCLLVFLWSWITWSLMTYAYLKGTWKKQSSWKVWVEENWRINKLTYTGNYSAE